jgi:hypothetical protein
MLLLQYRIILPIDFSSYKTAHVQTETELDKEFPSSKKEAGVQVEVIESNKCDKARLPGRRHQQQVSTVTRTVRKITILDSITKSSELQLDVTSFSSDSHFKSTMFDVENELTIDTVFKPMTFQDQQNIFRLPKPLFDRCQQIEVDIVLDDLQPRENEDPKTKFGFGKDWKTEIKPENSTVVHMLVTIKRASEDVPVSEMLHDFIVIFFRKLVCSEK